MQEIKSDPDSVIKISNNPVSIPYCSFFPSVSFFFYFFQLRFFNILNQNTLNKIRVWVVWTVYYQDLLAVFIAP